MDDLTVTPAGPDDYLRWRELFAGYADFAAAEGWPHVRWRTAEDNYRARSAYDRHATRTPFLTYAMAAAGSAPERAPR